MDQTIESLTKEIDAQIANKLHEILIDHSDEITRSYRSINELKVALESLRTFIVTHPFNSKEEEMMFFKTTKPHFLSLFLYHEQILSLRLNEPFGEASRQQEYYKARLLELETYFKEHKEFYAYCISASTELDSAYFLRNGNSPLINIDRSFSTGYDYILSKLYAYQSAKQYINDFLLQSESKGETARTKLKWTGPKNGLVELIYSLQTAEALNNGKADVRQIASLFEEVFNVSLGNYYRVLQDIRLRKNDQASFLTELRNKFIERLDNIG